MILFLQDFNEVDEISGFVGRTFFLRFEIYHLTTGPSGDQEARENESG
jgi:hypothetical protein